MTKQRALVLGGGGFAASSWLTGLITGMAEAGVDVRDADELIGTSAGARVALQLASGAPLEEVFARQVSAGAQLGAGPQAGAGACVSAGAQPGAGPGARPAGAADMGRVQREVARAKELGGDRAEILRRYGALFLELGGPDRRAQVATQLPMTHWPERRMRFIALNAQTGVRRAFDRTSGIDLVDAVTATTAAFGSAPVWFEGQPYFDGGYYSSDNADLAAGYERVLVLALKAPPWALKLVTVEEGVAELRASGAEVVLIQPDDEVMEAIASAGSPTNPVIFDTVTRAGRAQGRRVVAERGTTGWW